MNLLCQVQTLSERKRAQLMWGRCINTQGYPGKNIPCDLHMEHLNRRLKRVIRGMGANVTPQAIQQAGKSIAAVHRVCEIFESQTATTNTDDHHPFPTFGEDMIKVLSCLSEENVFIPTSKRSHRSFKKFGSPEVNTFYYYIHEYTPWNTHHNTYNLVH